MKLLLGIAVIALLALQAPMAWEAYQNAQQCHASAVKQASESLGGILPELDMVDCSFMHYYRREWRQMISG